MYTLRMQPVGVILGHCNESELVNKQHAVGRSSRGNSYVYDCLAKLRCKVDAENSSANVLAELEMTYALSASRQKHAEIAFLTLVAFRPTTLWSTEVLRL